MKSFHVRLDSISPLLQHRYAGTDMPERKSIRRTGVKNWKDEANISLYQMSDGTIYQPSQHIESAMHKAAVNFKIPGKRNKTYRDLIRTCLLIDPQAIPHIYPDWKIENNGMGRPVIVNRARILRYRPEFDKWALGFVMTITDDELPADVVLDILQDAGKRVGLGDYRPKFGRFMVTQFTFLNKSEEK